MDTVEGNGEKRALDGEDLVSIQKLRKNRFQVRVLQDSFYAERCYSLSCAYCWVGFEFRSVRVVIRILGQWHSTCLLRRRRSLQTRSGSRSNRCMRGLPIGGPSCRPWQREPSDENSIDDPIEGVIVLALPSPRMVSRWLPVRPPQVTGR
ncbi:hypothetical protein BHE74_00030905 [Ensete ventricosum]|nr:hypothetical protein GW17_00052084 [Ensete ventricosum]RWW61987.1 hypothetical protein BHE74_00030905 [Ensete ventricosum]RZS02929.1 hypothetical protein BHM03_00033032 [Ensete ventricosum]